MVEMKGAEKRILGGLIKLVPETEADRAKQIAQLRIQRSKVIGDWDNYYHFGLQIDGDISNAQKRPLGNKCMVFNIPLLVI